MINVNNQDLLSTNVTVEQAIDLTCFWQRELGLLGRKLILGYQVLRKIQDNFTVIILFLLSITDNNIGIYTVHN